MSHWLGFKKVTMTPACPPLTPVPPCSALRRWRVLLSSGSPAPQPTVLLLHPPCSHRSASLCHSPTIPGYPEMAEPAEHLPRPKQCKKISSSEDRLEMQNNQLFQSGHSSLTLQPAASESRLLHYLGSPEASGTPRALNPFFPTEAAMHPGNDDYLHFIFIFQTSCNQRNA